MPNEPEHQSPDHDEIVAFVLGQLSAERSAELQAKTLIDKELAAKIELLRMTFASTFDGNHGQA
jgi:anti-sigma-K factor RskA